MTFITTNLPSAPTVLARLPSEQPITPQKVAPPISRPTPVQATPSPAPIGDSWWSKSDSFLAPLGILMLGFPYNRAEIQKRKQKITNELLPPSLMNTFSPEEQGILRKAVEDSMEKKTWGFGDGNGSEEHRTVIQAALDRIYAGRKRRSENSPGTRQVLIPNVPKKASIEPAKDQKNQGAFCTVQVDGFVFRDKLSNQRTVIGKTTGRYQENGQTVPVTVEAQTIISATGPSAHGSVSRESASKPSAFTGTVENTHQMSITSETVVRVKGTAICRPPGRPAMETHSLPVTLRIEKP
ncbi:hypothetical protein SAMN06265795_108132 [Noviherbaspirillum humi]|uniref:Uncharacterized protein n=1 Tax=Noviherbaspirillum humi TaxID=1688639 RepID=A0A239I5Y9_9BURK|nr:hypothetical protein [Noviherbaspirillum humi]SNS88718.1 hypothetical protein SAMN06265795_108132 [Noviherbaspirillum humi]